MMPKISGATNTQFPKQQAPTFGNSQATAPSRMPTVPTLGKPLPIPPPKKINALPANCNVKMPSPYTATVATQPVPAQPIEKKPAQNQQTTNLLFPSNNFSASASIPVSTKSPAEAPPAPRAAPPVSIKPPMLVTPFCTFAYPVPEKEAAYIANSRACKRIAEGQGPDSWSGYVNNLRKDRGDLSKNWNKIGWDPTKSQEHLDYALGKIDATITTTQGFKDTWLNNPLQTIDDVKDYERDKHYLLGELKFTFNYINYLNELKIGIAGILPPEPDATLTGINLVRNPVKRKPPITIFVEKGTRNEHGKKIKDGARCTLSDPSGVEADTCAYIKLISKKEMDKRNREKYSEMVVYKGKLNPEGKKIRNGDLINFKDNNGNTETYVATVISKKEYLDLVNKVNWEKYMSEQILYYQACFQRLNIAIIELPNNWANEELKNQLLPEYMAFLKSTAIEIEEFIYDFPNLIKGCKNSKFDYSQRSSICDEQIDQTNTVISTIQELRLKK